ARRSSSARPAPDRAPVGRRPSRSRRPAPPVRATPRTDRRRFERGHPHAPPPPWCWRRRRPVRSRGGRAHECREDTRTMRIVPVVDLKGGIVVHARRGQRADYAPLRSPLVDGCEPVAVARALCAAANATTLYV